VSATATEPSRSFEDLTRAVADRYHTRSAYYYVRSKLRMDPVSRSLLELAEREPLGNVIDVACGRGQVALLLRSAGLAESVVGFDWDADKVQVATNAAEGLGDVRFEKADVREVALPAADTVLLIDILHYLRTEEQDDLLVRSARAASGRVIVRDVDPDRGAASLLTHGWEWVTTTLGYNRGARVAPRSFDEITKVLESEGLGVSRELCSAKGMSNVLLVARRL
jgi:2-polyprenyl-3-methyl-5-hydroxy-6-metoxy-1,4-benzoquinol methylase